MTYSQIVQVKIDIHVYIYKKEENVRENRARWKQVMNRGKGFMGVPCTIPSTFWGRFEIITRYKVIEHNGI